MTEAWASYDEVTGTILAISWKKPANRCVAIDPSIAERVMAGVETMSAYLVDVAADTHEIAKKETPTSVHSTFWRLSIMDLSGIEILVDDGYGGLIINIADDRRDNFILFATLKNDPSWLVNSWKSTDLRWKGTRAFIKLDCPEKYSFYARATNEA